MFLPTAIKENVKSTTTPRKLLLRILLLGILLCAGYAWLLPLAANPIITPNMNRAELKRINSELSKKTLTDILVWVDKNFRRGSYTQFTSFGPSGLVILNTLSELKHLRFVDTLFPPLSCLLAGPCNFAHSNTLSKQPCSSSIH